MKNCARLKIDEETIDEAENLDLVKPMYNLIEYSSNYSDTTESLWFYSEDEATDFNAAIANDDNFKSFKYKAKLLGNTEANGANGILKNGTKAVPLKYLSNFWRSLENDINENDINVNDNANNIIFAIRDPKLYVPVQQETIKNNQNF